MGIFFKLFTNGISCVFYGLIVTISITIVLCFFISSKKGNLRSIPFFLLIAMLFIALFVNMTVIAGAIKIKKVANNALTVIEQLQEVIASSSLNEIGEGVTNGNYKDLVKQVERVSGHVDVYKLQELKKQLGGSWDLLRLYFESSDMSPAMLLLSPTRTITRFNSKMNGIILRRILWSVLFIAVVIVAIRSTSISGRPSKTGVQYSSKRTTSSYDEF